MNWTGASPLSDEKVSVPEYKAVSALPDLTVTQAVTAFGHQDPKESTETTANGKDWQVSIEHSEFLTRVRYWRTCEDPATDAMLAISTTKDTYKALGGDPEAWTWFTVPAPDKSVRVVAEPNIEGVQTWGTGTIAAFVDAKGVCQINTLAMAFEDTGKTLDWDSASDVFAEARNAEGLAVAGDYEQAEQTWTMATAGRLVPVWRFSTAEAAIVAVDLGDGLETAPDTETALRATGEATPTP